ncbi:hypothetical protein KGD82_02220 [Nocardiopsis eucommiae]|uniref:Uncharacterized protein n=1 Tax=Nocardiopsis eucommiae TaxID=2831970 RepID=A0A975LAX0_9ACTN|nr:hypothetical protein KGD82_02220 [Nocardiopsis eucommiae]
MSSSTWSVTPEGSGVSGIGVSTGPSPSSTTSQSPASPLGTRRFALCRSTATSSTSRRPALSAPLRARNRSRPSSTEERRANSASSPTGSRVVVRYGPPLL